jgi:Lrp/AsnC family leucine-responsive transcriptional regulator
LKTPKENAMTLDRYDRVLLDALLENGRASFAQLARLVNLSAPAVAERVAKLEASGVITGYQAKVDMAKIGLPIQCVIELRLANHGNQKTYDELWKIPELIQCHRVTGDPCVIMQAAVGSMPELESLINRVAQFGFSKTSIILSTAVERKLPLNHLDTQAKPDKTVVNIRADV